MSITRAILNKCENEMNKIDNDFYEEKNEIEHPYAKAFVIGMIEGAIDTIVVGTAMSIVGNVLSKTILKKK